MYSFEKIVGARDSRAFYHNLITLGLANIGRQTISGASVVIPIYYREEGLGSAIRSALEQTYSDTEIIVVDDSDDGEML